MSEASPQVPIASPSERRVRIIQVVASLAFAFLLFAVAIGAVWYAQGFRPTARLAPRLAAVPMAIAMAVVVAKELRRSVRTRFGTAEIPGDTPKSSGAAEGPEGPLSDRPILGTYPQAFFSLATVSILFYVLGSVPTALLFPPIHLLIVGAWSLRGAFATSLVSGGLVWLLLERLLNVRLYGGLF